MAGVYKVKYRILNVGWSDVTAIGVHARIASQAEEA